VLKIDGREKEWTNTKFKKCTYKVGEMVESDKWNEDRLVECTNGIHFFLNKKDAEKY